MAMELLDTYKEHQIWNDEGAICVNRVTDGKEYLFYVALDDSKTDGNRKWIAEANNTETAKEYIDWLQTK